MLIPALRDKIDRAAEEVYNIVKRNSEEDGYGER